MRKAILSIMLSVVPVAGCAAEERVIEVGTKPESVCRGFGGKLYVTMIEGDEPGDGGINVIDGAEVSEFCRGMDSPKGLAFVGGYLVTADETTVWKVDNKGEVTKVVGADGFPAPVEFLNDVAAARDGESVYVTEMSHPERMFDPAGERKLWETGSGEAKLPMTGCVYKVGLDGSVEVAVPPGSALMPAPNGVTVTGKKGAEVLVMGDFFTGNIVQYRGGEMKVLGEGMRGADAVAVGKGVIYVSSWPLGKVWRLDRKSKEKTLLSDKFTTAADFYYDRKGKQLVVPDMLAGTVTFLPVE